MNVVEQLRKSNKAKLVYNRGPATKKFLDDCASPPDLSCFHTENDYNPPKSSRSVREVKTYSDRNSVKFTPDDDSVSEDSYYEKKDPSFINLQIRVSPRKRTVITVSPDYGRSVQAIRQYEDSQDNRVKTALSEKQKQFKEHSDKLNMECKRKLADVEQRSLYKAVQLQEQTEDQFKHGETELQMQHLKMKEDHMQHAKMLEIRHQKLQEEIRRKEQEKKERSDRITQLKKDVKTLVEKLLGLQQTGTSNNKLAEDIKKLMEKVKQMVTQASHKEEQEGDFSPDVENKYKETLKFCLTVYEGIRKKLEEEDKRMKEEAAVRAAEESRKKAEEQAQQAAAAAAAAAGSASSSTSGAAALSAASIKPSENEELCADPEAFLLYTKLQEGLKTSEDAGKALSTPQDKKLKFDIQKAINIPINAISPVSGDHLTEKLQRLLTILAGHQVELGNKRISVNNHPQGLVFAKHLFAKMIVKKGEELVSSKHEAAFAIAMVTVGVWARHLDIGDLLIANFHSLCPYIVPYHIPRQEGQSVEDYHKALGYKYDSDGVVEKQDKFLKRMSGIMRLYAAILVSTPPRGSSTEHPHGVENAWIWLARMMNIRPLPDVTATMIYDMLQVTGFMLHRNYHKQFQKMLHFLIKEYLPKLKSVASTGGSGPVSRLETLLQDTLKNHGQISQPDGLLPPNFWNS